MTASRAIQAVLVFLLSLVLSSCSSRSASGRDTKPETVVITYRAKSGKEAELQATLIHSWQIYRSEHLVFAEPHTIVRIADDAGKFRFVETFTWVNHSIPDFASDAVTKIWAQQQSLCEARGGYQGIEADEVELVTRK